MCIGHALGFPQLHCIKGSLTAALSRNWETWKCHEWNGAFDKLEGLLHALQGHALTLLSILHLERNERYCSCHKETVIAKHPSTFETTAGTYASVNAVQLLCKFEVCGTTSLSVVTCNVYMYRV